jgi:hypothetical protein
MIPFEKVFHMYDEEIKEKEERVKLLKDKIIVAQLHYKILMELKEKCDGNE